MWFQDYSVILRVYRLPLINYLIENISTNLAEDKGHTCNCQIMHCGFGITPGYNNKFRFFNFNKMKTCDTCKALQATLTVAVCAVSQPVVQFS